MRIAKYSVTIVLILTITACGLGGNSKPTPVRTFHSGSSQVDKSPQACTSAEISGGANWISGQLESFKQKNLTDAYNYASPTFKEKFSLIQFMSLIKNDYSMLLDLQSFTFTSCVKVDQYFQFKLKFTDKKSNKFQMQYILTLANDKWGVDAAGVTQDS